MKKTQKFLIPIILLVSILLLCVWCNTKKEADNEENLNSEKVVVSDVTEPEIKQEIKTRIDQEVLQYIEKTENFEYKAYETYVEIYEYIGTSKNVIIPEKIDDIPVKVIGGFSRNEQIETVQLPEGILVINYGAFNRCTNLCEINIPNTVVEIRDEAFYVCTSLKSLTIPKNVTNLGSCAFGIGYGKYPGHLPTPGFTAKVYKSSAALTYAVENDIACEIIDLES